MKMRDVDLNHDNCNLESSYIMADMLGKLVKKSRISTDEALQTILSTSMQGYWRASCIKNVLADLSAEGFVDPVEAVQMFMSSGISNYTLDLIGPEFIKMIANVKRVDHKMVVQTIVSSVNDDRTKSNLIKEFSEELVEKGTVSPEEAIRAIESSGIDSYRKERCIKYLMDALTRRGYVSAAEADEAMLSVKKDELYDVVERILSGKTGLRKAIDIIMETDTKDSEKTHRVEMLLERLVRGGHIGPFDAIQAVAKSDMEESWKNLRYRELLEYLAESGSITPDLAIDLLLKTETICPLLIRNRMPDVKDYFLPDHRKIIIPEMDRSRMSFHLKELLIRLVRDGHVSADKAIRIIISSGIEPLRLRELLECFVREKIVSLYSAIHSIKDTDYYIKDHLMKEMLVSLACSENISPGAVISASTAIGDNNVRDELFTELVREGIIEEDRHNYRREALLHR